MGPYRRALNVLQIREPCPEDWDAMEGSGPMRFCGVCEQNVYDLSELTPNEAHELLALFEGSACVRMRRRQDGTLVSADCTDARRLSTRWRVIRVMASGAATVGLVAATFGAAQAVAPSPGSDYAMREDDRSTASMGEVAAPSIMGRMSVRRGSPFEGSWIDPDELSLRPDAEGVGGVGRAAVFLPGRDDPGLAQGGALEPAGEPTARGERGGGE